ncbi:MAG TPA: NAD(P)-binding domain-containing protein [Hyphomicrobiaceae bacterium]|nr:NAD(P)-binding domain-containing protein [Hyphomicrobiaceae bacterium]
MSANTLDKYCIIGAGMSGVAVAKTFIQRGIPFDIVERENDIGGLWNIKTGSRVVYESTHLVSAVSSTAFEDYPVSTDEVTPDGPIPDYPSHEWVMNYLRDYARIFGVTPRVEFGRTVEKLAPVGDGTWTVKIAGEPSPRTYKGVVVANGHHEAPRLPTYPGDFAGEIIHSRQYVSQRQVRDRRVLVVGAGNSACDIIKDAAHASGAKVVMSMRRGTWFVPKFILGFPTGDVVGTIEWLLTPLPRLVKRYLFQASLWVLQGPPTRYHMPAPAYAIDKAHPTMSDDVPRLVSHGRVIVRPEIARYEGNDVVFTDGSRETVDVIIFATGYKFEIPFLDRSEYFDANGRPTLYKQFAHPRHPNLFFAGLIQANGSIWRLADYQGRIIANAIVAERSDPSEYAEFRARVSRPTPVSKEVFVDSERHKLEANYFDYARDLKREAKQFKAAGKLPYAGDASASANAATDHTRVAAE